MGVLPSAGPAILRIILDAKATEAVQAMIARLKAESPHLKGAPSRVTSVIVARYFEKHFENDVDALAQLFFDSKEYLAAELPNAKTDDELKQVLAKALAGLSGTVQVPMRRGRKAAPSQHGSDHD